MKCFSFGINWWEMPLGRTCLHFRIQNCFWSRRNWAVFKKEWIKCLKVDAEWKTSPSEAIKTIRPCRQSVFSFAYFELGRRWQLVWSGKEGFLELLEVYFCTPEQDFLLGMCRGARPFFLAALFRSQCSSYISLAHHTYLCYLLLLVLCLLKLWCRSSLFTWSTFWLGWKLTPFRPIN